MDSNQSGAVGETIWDPIQGSLTHLGASGRLQSQIQAIPGQILTNSSDLGMKLIFYELSLAMVVAGIVSYILFIVQLFVLPNYTCTTSCSCNEVTSETSDQQEEGPSGPLQESGSKGCQEDADETSR